MQTEKTRQERLRKWLNLQLEERKKLLAKRYGVGILAAIGSSGLGGGSVAPDDSPDGEEEQGDGKEELTDALETGDELEKLKLYDCETGEEVTIDGLGGNGAKPIYPTGFEDCKAQKKPTMADLDGKSIYRITYNSNIFDPSFQPEEVYSLSKSKFDEFKSDALSAAERSSSADCKNQDFVAVDTDTGVSGVYRVNRYFFSYDRCQPPESFYRTVIYDLSSSIDYKQAYIDSFKEQDWPAVDKNHLAYNAEKGCVEPLCPELNTAVLDKYQDCNDELILCDENGEKNKVKLNSDGSMDVTQAKFNQTSTIKNGKVTSVKKLTEAQKEKEFA